MAPQNSEGVPAAPDDGATRDRILAAATQCFLQLGIAKTTMTTSPAPLTSRAAPCTATSPIGAP